MKKVLYLLLFCPLLTIAGSSVALQPMGRGDLGAAKAVPTSASAKKMDRPASHAPVSLSWALETDKPLELQSQPHQTSSKGYWMTVDAADFDSGILLSTTHPGALVRVTPQSDGNNAELLDPKDLVLISARGETFSGGRGMDMLLSGEEQEHAKKRIFPQGSAVFRMANDLGNGELYLFAENMDYGSGKKYVVDVFEKSSDTVLRLTTGSDTYLEGQELRFETAFAKNAGTFSAETLSASLIAPDGRRFPLTVKPGQTHFAAPLSVQGNGTPGLWEVEVIAEAKIDGILVKRNARSAFALNVPTAVFRGQVSLIDDSTTLTAKLAVDVAVAGRYEVRAVLFGSDKDGQLKPLAVGNSAQWIEPGQGALSLAFDRALINRSGLGQPFVVKDLRLIHQNRMSLIHRQETGFSFPTDR